MSPTGAIRSVSIILFIKTSVVRWRHRLSFLPISGWTCGWGGFQTIQQEATKHTGDSRSTRRPCTTYRMVYRLYCNSPNLDEKQDNDTWRIQRGWSRIDLSTIHHNICNECICSDWSSCCQVSTKWTAAINSSNSICFMVDGVIIIIIRSYIAVWSRLSWTFMADVLHILTSRQTTIWSLGWWWAHYLCDHHSDNNSMMCMYVCVWVMLLASLSYLMSFHLISSLIIIWSLFKKYVNDWKQQIVYLERWRVRPISRPRANV